MISVVMCPACGWLQVTSALKTFNCRRCNKSKSLRRVKIIRVARDAAEARAIIIALRPKLRY